MKKTPGFVDFIVVGAGIAGLRAAIALASHGKVLVVTKQEVTESATHYAQGGIAVALSDEDEISLHFQDTIQAGDGIVNAEAAHVLVEEGPERIQELIEWGTKFDRKGTKLTFTREAAHSRDRILHAHGDSTGREIGRALYATACSMKNILFSEPYNFEEQEKLIDKAVKLAEGKPEVGLIVIDSITMHYRLTMRDETRRDERYGLTRQIAKLLRISRQRGIPVVVTSQVYTDIDTGAYMPLGGHMLNHNAKTIVRLERAGTSMRTAILDKHRHREEGARAAFRITANGLED